MEVELLHSPHLKKKLNKNYIDETAFTMSDEDSSIMSDIMPFDIG